MDNSLFPLIFMAICVAVAVIYFKYTDHKSNVKATK